MIEMNRFLGNPRIENQAHGERKIGQKVDYSSISWVYDGIRKPLI